MILPDVFNNSGIPALEKMLSFTQARQKMLAENIANVDTPGYRIKQLDPAKFQTALRQAVDNQKAAGPSAALELPGTDQFSTDASGLLKVKPSLEPAENVLFHDGTNVRIERQMAMMAENAMMHQTAAELLRNKYECLTKAIQGRS